MGGEKDVMTALAGFIADNTSLDLSSRTLQLYYFENEPDRATLLRCYDTETIYDYRDNLIYHMQAQSRGRSILHAQADCQEVFDFLHRTPRRLVSLDGMLAYSIICTRGPTPMETDENGRFIYICSFKLDIKDN